jgi:hypothetical protein
MADEETSNNESTQPRITRNHYFEIRVIRGVLKGFDMAGYNRK